MRGEHCLGVGVVGVGLGSSPHARGTLCMFFGIPLLRGIIPACAGNTESIIFSAFMIRDHPRMRGEHYPARKHCEYGQGSSPHARGTPMFKVGVVDRGGIIPACAGNTDSERLSPSIRGDHPRMRGEHRFGMACALFHAGSSPHARGTPLWGTVFDHCRGIIPACAGNTESNTDWSR